MIAKSDILQAAANYLYCDVKQLECELKVYAAHSAEFDPPFVLEQTRYPIGMGDALRCNERELFYIVNEFCVNCIGYYGFNVKFAHGEFIKVDFSTGGVFASVIALVHPEMVENPPCANGQIIYYHIKRK